MRICISNIPILKPTCTKYTQNCMYGHATLVLMYSLWLEVCVCIWKSDIPLYTRALYRYILYIGIHLCICIYTDSYIYTQVHMCSNIYEHIYGLYIPL